MVKTKKIVMKAIYKIFIIICCFSGCVKKNIIPEITYKLELKPVDTTLFANVKDISKLFYHYDEINDKEYLVVYNSSRNHFAIFDYTNGNKIKDFNIDIKINNIYVKNIDSIYVGFNDAFGEKGNIFGILNSNGEIIERINLYNIKAYIYQKPTQERPSLRPY